MSKEHSHDEVEEYEFLLKCTFIITIVLFAFIVALILEAFDSQGEIKELQEQLENKADRICWEEEIVKEYNFTSFIGDVFSKESEIICETPFTVEEYEDRKVIENNIRTYILCDTEEQCDKLHKLNKLEREKFKDSKCLIKLIEEVCEIK